MLYLEFSSVTSFHGFLTFFGVNDFAFSPKKGKIAIKGNEK